MSIELYHDDCFNIFPQLEDKSIDLVLCDMPYGTTACKWDTVIDLERMWVELKRIVKDNAAIVLTASQPFTTTLICSNKDWFKYCWVWQKTCGAGFLNSKNAPIKYHEDILVFSRGNAANRCSNRMQYNPQNLVKVNKIRKNNTNKDDSIGSRVSRLDGTIYVQQYSNYPTTILSFPNDATKLHPTQKPIALMEYLVKTYSNEGDTVLDFCSGSFTTGVACVNLNRGHIGIEKEKNYFDIGVKRIQDTIKCQNLKIEPEIYTAD
jgi:site-specific DNA-methyltransferase (adenine-specific)